jgi:hypothetical protein
MHEYYSSQDLPANILCLVLGKFSVSREVAAQVAASAILHGNVQMVIGGEPTEGFDEVVHKLPVYISILANLTREKIIRVPSLARTWRSHLALPCPFPTAP